MKKNSTNKWEYVVRDYLEMRSALKEPEQEHLLTFLKKKGLMGDAVKIYSAFSVSDCLVVIMNGMKAKTRLFYHPEEKLIEE